MSGRLSWSPSRWRSGSSGRRSSYGRRSGLARARSFLVRAVLASLATYALWLVFSDAILAFVARGAERVLLWTQHPPLVTSVRPFGDGTLEVRALLFEPAQRVGRWDASRLSTFLVASLGLALAVPARDRMQRYARAGGALAACLVVMAIVGAIQAEVVTATYAHGALGLRVLSEEERASLESLHEATDLVQLLLPAALVLLAYAPALLAEDRSPAEGSRRAALLAWGAVFAVIVAALVPPPAVGPEDRLARFERTAERNPGSARARLAVARELAILSRGEAAARSFAQALALDPALEPARVGLARMLLAEGEAARAAAVARTGLRGDEVLGSEQRALLVILAEALREEGRPCEGLAHLEKAFRRSPETRLDPAAKRAARGLRRACVAQGRIQTP